MRTDVFELHFLLFPNVSKKQGGRVGGGGVYIENSQTSKLEKMGSKNATFRCFVQNSCKHS